MACTWWPVPATGSPRSRPTSPTVRAASWPAACRSCSSPKWTVRFWSRRWCPIATRPSSAAVGCRRPCRCRRRDRQAAGPPSALAGQAACPGRAAARRTGADPALAQLAEPGSELAVQRFDDLLSLARGHVGQAADLDEGGAVEGTVAGDAARSDRPRIALGIGLGERLVAHAGDGSRRVTDRLQGGNDRVKPALAVRNLDSDLQQGAAGAVVLAVEDLALDAAGFRLREPGAGNVRCCRGGQGGAHVELLR